jgi:hypothetical protein
MPVFSLAGKFLWRIERRVHRATELAFGGAQGGGKFGKPDRANDEEIDVTVGDLPPPRHRPKNPGGG